MSIQRASSATTAPDTARPPGSLTCNINMPSWSRWRCANARKIRKGTILPGWLLKVTRYASLDALKMESRRQFHEREAGSRKETAAMAVDPSGWENLAPLLDQALLRLSRPDRDAVVLRFL